MVSTLLLKILGENKPCPNRMIYISSWSQFSGGSESGIHVFSLCHIRVEQTKPGGNPIAGDFFFCPNRKYYISFWPEFWEGSNCLIRNLKFDPQNQIWLYLCFSHMIISHYSEIWPPPMIYISFWPDFQEDSESGIHVSPLYHIRVEQTKPGGNPIVGDFVLPK